MSETTNTETPITPTPQKATTTKPAEFPQIGVGYSTGTTWYRQLWSSIEGKVEQVCGYTILHNRYANPDTHGTWTVPALATGSYWPALQVGSRLFDTEEDAIEAALTYFAHQRALLNEREEVVTQKAQRLAVKQSEVQP